MLPAPKPDAVSLADVLKSSVAAVRSEPNRLGLGAVDHAVVVLVDGLGVDALRARSGHARTLTGAMSAGSVIESGFPTTTAAGITSLTTGVLPGRHGIVGYSAYDSSRDRVINQLTGWDDHQDPATWQRVPTLFEQAHDVGLAGVAIGPERYRDSGFSRAALRGATYLGGATVHDRATRAAEWLRSSRPGVAYLYVPELDVAAHAKGWESGEWTAALETTDSALQDLVSQLGRRDGLVVTADHGVLDVPRHNHVLIDERPGLLEGVRHVAGEPRCVQLHAEPGADLEAVLERWQDSESSRAWVATREEVIASGWFGPTDDDVTSRMGEIFVAARKGVAYYDGRTAGASRGMIGQHGSLSPAEVRVPLVRFGAFAD